MFKKILFFLLLNVSLYAQNKENYSFDRITSGKIKNTNIGSNGDFYLIENSTNSDYYLKIIQYKNGSKIAELFHKNTKRIHFDFDIKFSNLNDIQKLITTKVDYIENSNSVRKHLDSISFEKDSIKNELIVRSFSYEKRRKKIDILKDFFYIFKDANELLEDKTFIENLKTINFNPYVRSDKLIRFVNVTDNKINSEIIYEKSVKYDYFISLKESY
jgi:hypothetical protein